MITPPGYGTGAASAWALAITAVVNGQVGGVFADATERDAELTAPTEGLIAYLATPDHVTIYQSGGWKLLAGAGTYTPTLGAGIVIGTGGTPTNAANWSFGGGVLQVEGLIQLGSTGKSIGSSGNHTVSLPAGFTATRSTRFRNLGRCRMTPAGGGYIGEVVVEDSTKALFVIEQIVSAVPSLQAITATFPATWATGDQILWSATIAGVMTS